MSLIMTIEKQEAPATQKAKIYNQIELITDKAHPDDLVLKANEEKIVITAKELGQLLKPKHPKSEAADDKKDSIQYLGQFGIKSPKQLIDLLKSETGEKAKKLLGDLLQITVALRDQQAQQTLRELYLRELFISQLRLYKLAKEEETAKRNAAYQQQIDKSLAYGAAMAMQQAGSNTDPKADEIDLLRKHIKASYALETQIIESQLNKAVKEAEELENEIVLQEEEYGHMVDRYSALDDHLSNLDSHYDEIEAIADPEEKAKAAETVLKKIQGEMKQYNADILQHYSSGENAQAEVLLNQLDGLSVQAQGLDAMMSAINLQKKYYNFDGDETKSIKNADYIVDGQQQLYKDKETGKFYLLAAGQDFANMSVDEKANAQEKYESEKPNISAIKNTISQNKATEFNLHVEKINELVTRSKTLQKNIVDLRNQYNQTKAAEAAALSQLNQPEIDLSKIPTPRPTMKANQPEAKSQVSPTPNYKQDLQAMRFNPTQEKIDKLINCFVLPNGQPNKAAQDLIIYIKGAIW